MADKQVNTNFCSCSITQIALKILECKKKISYTWMALMKPLFFSIFPVLVLLLKGINVRLSEIWCNDVSAFRKCTSYWKA